MENRNAMSISFVIKISDSITNLLQWNALLSYKNQCNVITTHRVSYMKYLWCDSILHYRNKGCYINYPCYKMSDSMMNLLRWNALLSYKILPVAVLRFQSLILYQKRLGSLSPNLLECQLYGTTKTNFRSSVIHCCFAGFSTVDMALMLDATFFSPKCSHTI